MNKKLQYNKFEIGLRLTISILLLNPLASLADTKSDKTLWLMSAIEDKSAQKTCLDQSCIHSTRPIKMRPFMPNRKLPSRKELELNLIGQQGNFDQENISRLNGQISTSVLNSESSQYNLQNTSYNQKNIQSYANLKTSHHSANTNIANSNNRFDFLKKAEQQLLSNQNVSAMLTTAIKNNNRTNSTAREPAINNAQNQAELSTIPLTSDTYSFNTDIPTGYPVAENLPFQTMQNNASASTTLGPPPFPLCLLPQSTLKQIIKGLAGSNGARSSTAPQSYFGSWHQNHLANNLAYAGFQSHLNSYTNCKNTSFISRNTTLPTVKFFQIRPIQNRLVPNYNYTHSQRVLKNKSVSDNQFKVASYPAYATHSLNIWNFYPY